MGKIISFRIFYAGKKKPKMKNMLLHGIGARGDTKSQNRNSFLKESCEYLKYLDLDTLSVSLSVSVSNYLPHFGEV